MKPEKAKWILAEPIGEVFVLRGGTIGSVWKKNNVWFGSTKGIQSTAQPTRGAAKLWVEKKWGER